MKLVAKGVSRQDAHEHIRVLSQQAGSQVKNEGKGNDLVERIRADAFFKPVWNDLDAMLDSKLYTGRSEQIVDKFCAKGGVLEAKLERYSEYIARAGVSQLSV